MKSISVSENVFIMLAHCREVTAELADLPDTPGVLDFEWRRHLRYYWNVSYFFHVRNEILVERWLLAKSNGVGLYRITPLQI
jgi:hypothetical protein